MKVMLFLLTAFLAGCSKSTPLTPSINVYITINSPIANAALKIGSEVKISWTCTGACQQLPTGDTIEVSVSPDGSTLYPIIVGAAANDEKTWVVGDTLTAVTFTKPAPFYLVIIDHSGALGQYASLIFSTVN